MADDSSPSPSIHSTRTRDSFDMGLGEKTSYCPLGLDGSDNGSFSCELGDDLSKTKSPFRRKWLVAVLCMLLVVTNVSWAAYASSSPPLTNIEQENSYPPSRTIMQPIYQDTEFNEEGENKERADNLWQSLFPTGNGVVSLKRNEAQEHGLHETAADPLDDDNGVYIIAGFHTLHCVTVLRNSLWYYRQGEEQTAPWSHIVHCLDMIRQTLMCNMDTTLMWLHDPDTFADGQLHVCKDFWQLHQWAEQHPG